MYVCYASHLNIMKNLGELVVRQAMSKTGNIMQ